VHWVNSAKLTTFKPIVIATVAHNANFEMRIAVRLVVRARGILWIDRDVFFHHLATVL